MRAPLSLKEVQGETFLMNNNLPLSLSLSPVLCPLSLSAIRSKTKDLLKYVYVVRSKTKDLLKYVYVAYTAERGREIESKEE